jgi:hypothetical protein
MDLLEKFAPEKKKPLVLTNVGKRAIGACYIPVGSVNLKNSESSVPGIISKIKYVYGRTYLPTQRTRRKRAKKKEKKNLVWPTERTIWPQTTSRIHTGCIKGRGTSPGPSQQLPWPQSANVCDEHTHRHTPRLQCVNGSPDVIECRFRSLQMQRNVLAPSLLELQRERRETTELRYSGRCRRQLLETHGAYSGPHVAKSLVYGPGLGFSWGDQASSPPQFNTYSRGSTHLGVAWPVPSFFLPFDFLTVGTPVSNLKPWDLDWLGLKTRDFVSK